MAVCQICGNDGGQAFRLTTRGVTHTFDTFGARSLPSPRPAPAASKESVAGLRDRA
jgi:hypothetical protein